MLERIGAGLSHAYIRIDLRSMGVVSMLERMGAGLSHAILEYILDQWEWYLCWRGLVLGYLMLY